jgi:hypothetical protein
MFPQDYFSELFQDTNRTEPFTNHTTKNLDDNWHCRTLTWIFSQPDTVVVLTMMIRPALASN